MEHERFRILLSAYACEPHRGSEPAVGWEWATRLAAHHDVWVLTRANNREGIERALDATSGRPMPRFLYLDLPGWVLRLKRSGLLPIRSYYVLWQWAAARRVRASRLDIDIIHHVTFNAFLFPGRWWNGPWKVVLGPLGGASVCSPWYRRCFGHRWWRERLRTQLLRWWRLNRWTVRSLRSANALIFVTGSMAREFADDRANVSVMLETAVPDAALCQPDFESDRAGFLWVGSIEPRKGWRLALESFARAFGSASTGPSLRFIGSGPDELAAKRLANDLGIAARVQFSGPRSRGDVWEAMRRAKALLFSSVRDTSGNVVLEAMAARCPVICLNHQGAGQMTDDSCALRVEPAPWDDTVSGFAAALQRLDQNPELVHALGNAGRARVAERFTWQEKIHAVNELYASVMRH